MSNPQAGWYTDLVDARTLRWWDGSRWTAHVQPHPEPPPVVPVPEPEPTPRPAMETTRVRSVGGGPSGDAPSIGAALLPPLPKTTSSAEATTTTTGTITMPERAASHRNGLLGALVIALVLLLAGGAYAMGALDGVLGTDEGSREASSPAVRVVQGDGFSYEVPTTWNDQPVTGKPSVLGAYTSTLGLDVFVVRTPETDNLPEQLDAAGLQQVVLELVVQRILQSNPGYQVTSREPAEVGGSAAGRVVVDGTENGAPDRAVLVGFVAHKQLWLLEMDGPPDAVNANLPEFDALVSSFRLE